MCAPSKRAILAPVVKSFDGVNTMIEFYCESVSEARTEVEACQAHVVYCQQNLREELKLAKAALRNAKRELHAWETGTVPPLVVVSPLAQGATA